MQLDGSVVGIVCALVIGSCFIVLFFVCWKGTVSGQQAELQRMTACVETGKNWIYNEDATEFECKP